ncbi:hypothetical protein BJF80_14990 [Serinicoccus sp. CUA-874]|nr:hypothetical protein BJF80_14990 [Serinicoccus sp. CUA-874]
MSSPTSSALLACWRTLHHHTTTLMMRGSRLGLRATQSITSPRVNPICDTRPKSHARPERTVRG